MDTYKRLIDWFEIPVKDLEASARFYTAIFERELHKGTVKGLSVYFFNMGGTDVNGALVQSDDNLYRPTKDGCFIYFNGGDDLDKVLRRVEKNGGVVLTQKALISKEIGYYAHFSDLDNNTIGLHCLT